jgi:hypothetical protein
MVVLAFSTNAMKRSLWLLGNTFFGNARRRLFSRSGSAPLPVDLLNQHHDMTKRVL